MVYLTMKNNIPMPLVLKTFADRIQLSPIGNRLVKGAFWSLIGAMIARALTLLASIFVARLIGKQGFGALGVIQSTVGMFSVLLGLA